MRIAYLTSDFGVPVLGRKGASVHVRRVVGALLDRGHEVLVLTPSLGGSPGDPLPFRIAHLPFKGIPEVLYENLKKEEICQGNRLSKDLRNIFYALWLEGQAAPLLAEFEPDCLYERYTLFGCAGRALAERFSLPHLLEVNAPLVEEQREQRGLTLSEVADSSQRMIFSGADEVIVVSRWLENYVIERGGAPDRTTVLPNAADPELFRPAEDANTLRQQLGWEDCCVMGFVGAMKSWHGVPSIVEALEVLGAPESRFRLLLVGEGPVLPAVREEVSRRGLERAVHFAGAVPHDEVPRWLGAADIALIPYAGSAAPYFSPVKLFECMAMGMPVIAARLGQTEEIVEDGENGFLVSPSEPEELAEKVRWLAEHEADAARVGARAREFILGRYTWDHNARCVERLAERALARMRPTQEDVAVGS